MTKENQNQPPPKLGPEPQWGRAMRRDGGNNQSSTRFVESLTRIRHLIRKEFLQIVRNKQNFRILLIAPIFQLLLFGYAVRLDVKEVATVVVDMDRSSVSRQLVDAFSRSGYFVIKARLSSYEQADYYLERGEATMALLIPPDLERRLNSDQTTQVGVLIDGVDTTLASTVSGYGNAILQQFSIDMMESRIKRAKGLRYSYNQPNIILPGLEPEVRAWFNPNLESKDFFVPGILALVLTFFSLVSTAMVLVREKETGTIEQLMVTPITPLELVLGKTIPSFIISLVNLVCLTILALVWFQPPFKGSMPFFCFCAVLYIITCLSIGMTVSAFCRTQQQAILSSFMVLQPAVLLSGFVFPIDNMPVVIQYATYINPLRYFIVIVREVFLKGIGWEILWPQVLPIAAMGIGFIGLSALLFKKKID